MQHQHVTINHQQWCCHCCCSCLPAPQTPSLCARHPAHTASCCGNHCLRSCISCALSLKCRCCPQAILPIQPAAVAATSWPAASAALTCSSSSSAFASHFIVILRSYIASFLLPFRVLVMAWRLRASKGVREGGWFAQHAGSRTGRQAHCKPWLYCYATHASACAEVWVCLNNHHSHHMKPSRGDGWHVLPSG